MRRTNAAAATQPVRVGPEIFTLFRDTVTMPLALAAGVPFLVVRTSSFERAGLTRRAIDERLNLTPDEFRVEGGLVVIGPIPGDEELTTFVEELERVGLVYFEDFFDLSGNWPEWLKIFVMAEPA